MERHAHMLRFAASLQAAAHTRDWRYLQRLNEDVNTALRRWREGPALSEAEQGALQHLRAAHANARATCVAEMQTLGVTLERMREGRERWRAYAASGEWLPEGEIPV